MEFITATVEHLPAIVQLLADDGFGITLERYEIPLPKEYIEAFAKTMGCTMIQLRTDKQRKDAHKFYERLGFIASHDGMKLVLSK
ncbi:GNAT family N-acetyltransferase [Paenibacillus sp. 1781tsa1]|uniref:GNAT family N-acetyltransferase n=1 Tax=Paenibacillus sp. 1781tsa1 TaxID=2953810 RepID=UPI00209DF5CC|nr:GNAT family N-acetyltransferase [Paenibacillus sp. 1781tsa1]MCP1184677.1 GNAT family N-acetyltransferase [Paenibacillus sp. 1781tsa1]